MERDRRARALRILSLVIAVLVVVFHPELCKELLEGMTSWVTKTHLTPH